jgi:sucrose phosphorylase
MYNYHSYPDYTQEKLAISEEDRAQIFSRLSFLYGEAKAKKTIGEIERVLTVHYAHKPPKMIEQEKNFELSQCFSHKDVILITYGDLLRSRSEHLTPLNTLKKFLQDHVKLQDIFSTIHILPFFPYSSDRGFSVTDYRLVDPHLGSWQDIQDIGTYYRLMFDGVFNHISAESFAFQELLNGNPQYQNFATIYQSPYELTPEQRKILIRPRTSDILTEYQSINGPIWVWTTFSPDQIDLNFQNPQVLIYVLETLLLYIRRGASLIRLDAITYLWDEPGTSGASLPQTHEIVKLCRDILNIAAPTTAIVTETNVPHEENVSYFGNGRDEAQMVYNFALPPLVLYTFYQEDSTILSQWAEQLEYPSSSTTFLNILDTHDGIGLMGVKNILPPEEIDWMIEKAKEHGAFISFKTGESGEDVPYEINSTWFSALNFDHDRESTDFKVKRFVASRSIALALKGVPAIYFHGLIGSSNDVKTVISSKIKRDINRSPVEIEDLSKELQVHDSKLSIILQELGNILETRVRHSAFAPQGSQQVFNFSPDVFSLLRISPDSQEHILTLANVTSHETQITISFLEIGIEENYWYDLIQLRGWIANNDKLIVTLQPYQVIWLIPFAEIEKRIEN